MGKPALKKRLKNHNDNNILNYCEYFAKLSNVLEKFWAFHRCMDKSGKKLLGQMYCKSKL